ncbi:hypothetical protein [Methanothermobacter thermautotrophicus]|uniref:hypothetical protein n=1 Tax=Methanothermobacter thermautotrophicus TaxID=145262 RepID=UPI0030B8B684
MVPVTTTLLEEGANRSIVQESARAFAFSILSTRITGSPCSSASLEDFPRRSWVMMADTPLSEAISMPFSSIQCLITMSPASAAPRVVNIPEMLYLDL